MNKIIERQYFSATDLKNKTKSVLDTTQDLWEVFIMNNNKPKVVIMSIEKYNNINKYYIPEVEPDEWEKQSIAEYEKQKKEWNLEFISSDVFFNSLKNV